MTRIKHKQLCHSGTAAILALALASAGAAVLVRTALLRKLPPGRQHLQDAAPSNHSSADIGRVNLLCAQGLPGTENLEISELLATLNRMSDRVRSETEGHWYRFQRSPAEFENSEGFFRMLMLTVVLAEDFGIHYDEARKSDPARTSPADDFFMHPDDVFLHGLLGPNRQGTCSSMPVLYVAVGRRLGYPLKLVTTKAHLFVRWEGNGERFNIEATSHGLNRFPDEYYRHWPFEISLAEEAAQGYLKSLTPPEELAVFLSTRAMCLRESGRFAEAAEAFGQAARLAPGCQGYRAARASLDREVMGRVLNSVSSAKAL